MSLAARAHELDLRHSAAERGPCLWRTCRVASDFVKGQPRAVNPRWGRPWCPRGWPRRAPGGKAAAARVSQMGGERGSHPVHRERWGGRQCEAGVASRGRAMRTPPPLTGDFRTASSTQPIAHNVGFLPTNQHIGAASRRLIGPFASR